MKPSPARQRTGGFTGWDLFLVVVAIGLLVALLLPALARSKYRTKGISCVSSLKQIGLAFRMWANDHGEKFPMQSSAFAPTRGTMEFNLTGDVWRHFQIISNELNSPKLLTCSSDQRTRIADWSLVGNNRHLSYFVGLDADQTRPRTMLSGDRNLQSSVASTNGVLVLTQNDQLGWTTALHNRGGNICFGDGSVQQVFNRPLNEEIQSALQSTGRPVHRLALPE